MTKNQRAILYIVINHGPISEIQINKSCTMLYQDIHKALRALKRDGFVDTGDDDRYFAVPARNAKRPACEISQDEVASLDGFYSGVEA